MKWSQAINKYRDYLELAGNSIDKIDIRIEGIKVLLNEVSSIKNYQIENIRASNWNRFIQELNRAGINPTNNRYRDLRGCYFLAKKHYRCRGTVSKSSDI